jgi:methionyl-tRNA formyltransferase
MRIGWIGSHREGLPALRAVLQAGFEIAGVITLRKEKRAARSGHADYGPICHEYGVPLHEVDSLNTPDSNDLLQRLDWDFAIVLGWNEILHGSTMTRVKRGLVGAHASLLPKDRGSAPINWSLIRGDKRTGNTLIWLAEGVDSGDIIDQRSFDVTPYDTCHSLYEAVAASNRDMLLDLLPRLLAGERPGNPQAAGGEDKILPRRRPSDGKVDWRQSSQRVYDFVRALTRPYPGAFSYLDGECYHIWRASLLPGDISLASPGICLGPVFSPTLDACGQQVACGKGSVILLEVSSEATGTLEGRALGERDWQGKGWKDEK